MTRKEVERFFLTAGWSLYEKGHVVYAFYPEKSIAYNIGSTDAVVTDNWLHIVDEYCGLDSKYTLKGLFLDDNGDLTNSKRTLRLKHENW